ncbi:hypothetical protein [Desulfocurvus vexinensis]|uniref:hypothetical protein n=1 Tax=Desulfocurvus vexinensis TaxID=399548 RepID=UPI0004BC9017|nr:hypothetical protein [Desulfocurvus vexinensis]
MHRILLAALAMVALLAASGCQSVLSDSSAGKPQTQSQARSAPTTNPVGSYQEFNDVLIPNELSLVGKSSFVFETPSFKTGIVVYKGRVDSVSLANFFEKELPKDNWRLRSRMKYNRTIMVFEKPDRDCIINIIDDTFSTLAEIIVAPRMDGGGGVSSQPSYSAPTPSQSSPFEETLPQ